MLGAAAVGYDWIGARIGAGDAEPSVEVSAQAAVSAALDHANDIPARIRRVRLDEALRLCQRPSANCRMEDVLRVGNELRRLRNDE
jgi:hypothetical protein